MNVYILYILILQCFLNNRHDMYALFHLKQTNKLLYQLSLNINVKINDILKKYFSRSNIYQSNDLSHDLIFNMQNKNYGPCNQLFLKIAHYFVNKFGSHY